MRFIGVELDRLSGRMARVLHPGHDIRIEHLRDTHLPADSIDAGLGNVPFADLRLDYHGTRRALHDFFLAKSLDALKPGGILALVTSHYTLDKQRPELRTQLAQQADFLGALRLPAEAFAQSIAEPDATIVDGCDERLYSRDKLQLLRSEENAQRSGQCETKVPRMAACEALVNDH
jgi:hypothetical protein